MGSLIHDHDSMIRNFTHSFNQYLISNYCVPHTVLYWGTALTREKCPLPKWVWNLTPQNICDGLWKYGKVVNNSTQQLYFLYTFAVTLNVIFTSPWFPYLWKQYNICLSFHIIFKFYSLIFGCAGSLSRHWLFLVAASRDYSLVLVHGLPHCHGVSCCRALALGTQA